MARKSVFNASYLFNSGLFRQFLRSWTLHFALGAEHPNRATQNAMKKATVKGTSRVKQVISVKKFPKKHFFLICGVATVVLGFMALLPSEKVEARRSEIPLSIDAHQAPASALDTLSSKEEMAESPSNQSIDNVDITQIEKAKQAADALLQKEKETLGSWVSEVIKPGDNLSALFKKQGLSASDVYLITSTPEVGKLLSEILPGQTLEFRINSAGELTQFRYQQSKLKSFFFEKTDKGYTGKEVILEPDVRMASSYGQIDSSLFLASQKAGLSDNLTMQLAGIFGWDIDFVQDIREGDSFSVIYEEKYLDGEKLSDGNILAASFTNQGETYTAVRYTDSKGETGYYTPDGKSMKKAFLRTPVDFTRISSQFNPNRLHPIFKTKRPHRGVDYAAPTNTPIKAAGDGKVKYAGWQRGFGNIVCIEHPNNIVTAYAHQNKIGKGIKIGVSVKQGQIIGYVGQTGWATGPHLHYEFRVNGIHRNPVTVKLPDASPISKKEMARFKLARETVLAKLDKVEATMLAQK